MNPPDRERTVVVGTGVELPVRIWLPNGTCHGTVVLVHGLGEHSGRYGRVASRLASGGWAVLAYDQRGHGRAPGPRGHAPLESLLDDIEQVLALAGQELPGISRFLYGHSLGGALVAQVALSRHPEVDGLILTSPLFRPAIRIPAWKNLAARALRHVAPQLRMKTRIDPHWLTHDPDAIRIHQADPLIHGQVSCQLGVEMLAAGESALAHAEALHFPTLLMHGDADPLTSVDATREFAARTGAHCTLEIWEGMAHELHWERDWEEVVVVITDWLNGQIRPPGVPEEGVPAAPQGTGDESPGRSGAPD